MNIQKLIKQYEDERDITKEAIKKSKEARGVGALTYGLLVSDLNKTLYTIRQLKTLQTEMRGYLGRFSNKLNKANVILAFGLGEDE